MLNNNAKGSIRIKIEGRKRIEKINPVLKLCILLVMKSSFPSISMVQLIEVIISKKEMNKKNIFFKM